MFTDLLLAPSAAAAAATHAQKSFGLRPHT